MKNMSIILIQSLLILTVLSPLQKSNAAYPKPSTVFLIGMAPFIGYGAAHKEKVIEATRWVTKNWNSIPGIVKYPVLWLGGLGVYYTFYNSLKPSLPLHSNQQSDITELKSLLSSVIIKTKNIQEILEINFDPHNPEKAASPSIIAELKLHAETINTDLGVVETSVAQLNQINQNLSQNCKEFKEDIKKLKKDFHILQKGFEKHKKTTAHINLEDADDERSDNEL